MVNSGWYCTNIQLTRRVWRYQRRNQNSYIEEEQTTKGQRKKVQKDKQRSIKHTHKTKDRVTRTPLKPGGELRWALRFYHLSATLYIIRLCHIYSKMLQGGTIAMSMGKDVDNWKCIYLWFSYRHKHHLSVCIQIHNDRQDLHLYLYILRVFCDIY